MNEHEPGTSASTIRGLRHIDMTLLSNPTVGMLQDDHPESHSPYRPSSPHSAFQSEPGSPSGDSVSSFPSVGSSFLFSSGPTTPPHPGHSESEVEDEGELGDSTSGLVIPSLTLPSPSRRPSPYGQTLGDVRLLLLGPRGADLAAIASQLVDDNEDVVEVGLWEEDRSEDRATRGKRNAILRVSTHWVEHRDRHGLERVEPARNVEIVQLPPYDLYSEPDIIVDRILPVIHAPFREVSTIISQDHPPTGGLAHLLSSPCSPLYTSLIMVATPSALLPIEKTLVESLSSHVPIILLPTSTPNALPTPSHDRSRRASTSHLSSFRPNSMDALRSGLFRTPTTLATLRSEAASRFLRWREVERAVERVQWSTGTVRAPNVPGPSSHVRSPSNEWWDKQTWEAQWEGSLSQEVALHLRRRRRSDPPRRTSPLSSLSTIGRQPSSFDTIPPSEDNEQSLITPPCAPASFDPLHLPSLLAFSFSLFGALRTRIARSIGFQGTATTPTRPVSGRERKKTNGRSFAYKFGIGFALMSAFCAGVGLGLVAAARF
ncbi:hypothetical protein L226DRAFT_534000 [Lentinus tigrinus ALCF2SS1-7]|uniref:Uncharacterized protein n=1 Tax=Lentinus tigrinus ALCF2SS1-6 TaxID=1328759 RepID=A0A5C2SK44_9APHY|nr:hypothetical protein L227DRAFT_574295 [Lentinus tigrinus ALCF2SS1-6]RPD75936.1 hypothetical protein L226DRAFT_534000 [Lentinus tigrinus ALCF2SS1-7]